MPGSAFTANSSFNITTTQDLITLDDGTMAISFSTSVSWSGGFTWRAAGEFDSDDLVTPPDALSEDAADRMDVEAEAGFKLFASGSAGGSFSVSGTYPVSLDPSTAETNFSFSFGLAAMAGGSMHSSVTASLDESSGDAESDTDEYLKVDVDNSMQASGKAGFSFQVGFSSEDIVEFGLASDTGSGIGLDTIESPQPASDFTGMQFSMGVTASSKQSDSLSFGEKVRSQDYLTKTRDEISVENSSSSKSDFDFSLSHGTSRKGFAGILRTGAIRATSGRACLGRQVVRGRGRQIHCFRKSPAVWRGGVLPES